MKQVTYRIEIFTHTAKGKVNHVADRFVSTGALRETVQKYYADKYAPLSVSVSEVEVLSIESANDEQKEVVGIEKISDRSMYSEPSYRIDRDSLPKEIAELIDKLDDLDKQVFEAKAAVNKELYKYFSDGGKLSSYSRDGITVSGRPNSFVLSLKKREDK